MKQPTISIIIPVYNTEKYLRKCLDSVINQTYKNLEIICINDGSSDNSLGLLNEYAAKDERIIVINQENSGVSAARNRGLDAATGEYIAFVDSDDWVEPQAYESALKEMLKDNEIDLVYFGLNAINNRGYTENEFQRLHSWYKSFCSGKMKISEYLAGRMNLGPVAKLYKKDIITKNNLHFPQNFIMAEDVFFNITYLAQVKKIYFINSDFYNYVLIKNSATDKLFFNKKQFTVENYIKLYSDLYWYFQKNDKPDLFFNIFNKSLVDRIIYNLTFLPQTQIIRNLENFRAFVLTIDTGLNKYNPLIYILKGEFYRIIALKIPYLERKNKFGYIKWYKTSDPQIIIKFLGLKISLHYQKLFSVKNINNRKVFNILGIKIKISRGKNFIELLKRLPGKIFSIYNEYKNNKKYKIVNILGIKIKHTINLTNKIKKFNKRNNSYLARKDKSITRRLFLTTGNLSLVNNLAIIRQLATHDCEDTLVILSNMVNNDFFETCKKIAALHNFKEVKCICSKQANIIEYFLRNKMTNFDEIYFSNQYQFINLATELYPNADWILTDEGCGGKLARLAYCDYDKVKSLIMHNYLGKIDFFGLQKRNYKKIIPLNTEIFQEVCRECAEMFPINLEQAPEDKSIIFCGSWYEVSGLAKDEYMSLQDDLINRLMELGYTILFKPHPRDPRNYVNNPNITILNTTLPLECYNPDVVAIVSLASSTPLHMINAHNIPGFMISLLDRVNKPLELMWLDLLVKKLMAEYTPPIEELLAVNPKLYTKQELKKVLQDKCKKYIDSKPLLSQNEEFKNFAITQGYILEEENEAIKC